MVGRLFVAALPPVKRRPLRVLPSGLLGYVWRVGATQQVRLVLLTLIVFPLSTVPLELQRRIVNGAVGAGDFGLVLALGGGLILSLLSLMADSSGFGAITSGVLPRV